MARRVACSLREATWLGEDCLAARNLSRRLLRAQLEPSQQVQVRPIRIEPLGVVLNAGVMLVSYLKRVV